MGIMQSRLKGVQGKSEPCIRGGLYVENMVKVLSIAQTFLKPCHAAVESNLLPADDDHHADWRHKHVQRGVYRWHNPMGLYAHEGRMLLVICRHG